MLAVIILVLIILLIISAFLLNKKPITDKSKIASKRKKILVITVLVIFVLIIINTLMSDGVKTIYCLSDDKCVTVWKRTNGEVYIIYGEYKGKKVPSDNYLKTSYKNAITIIVDNSSIYSYIIFNNYGGEVSIETSDYNIKYYDYEQREAFIKDYYIDERIKSSLRYLTINIKENLIILNGVKQ